MNTRRVRALLRSLKPIRYSWSPDDAVQYRLIKWAREASAADWDAALATAALIGGKVSSVFYCTLAPLREGRTRR